jgi:gluconolactonase
VIPSTPDLIPDPYEVLDERFDGLRGDDHLERLFTGCRWAEGPVYVASGRYLLFNDIPEDRTLRWDECTGVVGVFRSPSHHANGLTLDRQGRLISCEHSGRRVTRTELDGSITVLADRWDGRRLNSPNDAVVDRGGVVWFTDPPYGILTDYEGERAESEVGACNVYRVDPADGRVVLVADDFDRPNGLAFSADERRLFIADTQRGHIRVFDVDDDRNLANSRVFVDIPVGKPDGFRLDEDEHIWAAAGDGVQCFDPDGTLLGTVKVPEAAVANVVFGGPKRNRLFIAASTSIYSIHLKVNGLARLSSD